MVCGLCALALVEMTSFGPPQSEPVISADSPAQPYTQTLEDGFLVIEGEWSRSRTILDPRSGLVVIYSGNHTTIDRIYYDDALREIGDEGWISGEAWANAPADGYLYDVSIGDREVQVYVTRDEAPGGQSELTRQQVIERARQAIREP